MYIKYRVRSASIRHNLSRQESSLPIKILTLMNKKKVKTYIRPTEFESVHIVWKTNGLPLTYSRLFFFVFFFYFFFIIKIRERGRKKKATNI